MSKWLDRLADLPKIRKATIPQLTRLPELNSVSAVSANLGEPQFLDPLSGGSKNEKYPAPQLTEPTKSDAASWRACHLRHVNRVRGRPDYDIVEQAEAAFDRLLADWHREHGEHRQATAAPAATDLLPETKCWRYLTAPQCMAIGQYA